MGLCHDFSHLRLPGDGGFNKTGVRCRAAFPKRQVFFIALIKSAVSSGGCGVSGGRAGLKGSGGGIDHTGLSAPDFEDRQPAFRQPVIAETENTVNA
jgi:hypothetical protein